MNKVLYNIDQRSAVTTADQKVARDNIGAMAASASADFLAASASSDFAPASAIFTGVSANRCITGNGLSGTPVGLSARISAASSLSTASSTAYFNGFGLDGTADPYTSCRYRVGGWSILTNGSATHNHHVDGNASGLTLSWNTNYYWSNIHASGINQKDAWSPSRYSAEWAYTGATLKDYTGLSAVLQPSGLTLWNSASGSGRTVGIDDIDRWNSFTAGANPNTNNGITGDGTLVSPIGLSSRIEFPSATSGAAVGHRGMTVSSNDRTAWYYAAFASFEKPSATANYRASDAEFIDSNGTSVVNKSSIDRWNSLGVEDLTMFGSDYPIASANTVETGYNWVKRTVSATGLPALSLYGFGSLPSNQMSVVGSGGNFLKYEPPYSAIYLSGDEVDYNSSYLPASVSWPMRVDVWNLSHHNINVMTDTFHGSTSVLVHGESATIWYVPGMSRWTDMANV